MQIPWRGKGSVSNSLAFQAEVAFWVFTNIAFSTLGREEWDDFITWRIKQILTKFLPRNE